MNFLFICTSNRDRSPALETYFKKNYPEHHFQSAGVNKYFTKKNETHLVTATDIETADVIVYAEEVHQQVLWRDMDPSLALGKTHFILGLGEYTQGNINEDYLLRAETKLKFLL